ncbi:MULTISPECIES: pentapeptide repeat-containing protein [unclassified Streptomyces]|uniref:pentapeptide repeat-containing protein n=1 Tax=unclassified Streptomyces TaxID=2593676 RepID=UPI003211D1DF
MRPLLDLMAVECTGETAGDDCGLVAADAVATLTVDLRAYAASQIDTGRVYRNAAELAAVGHGLRTVLFVRGLCRERDIWLVDGWTLLRGRGTGTDLSRANLRGAQLVGAQLAEADLSEADLRGADLAKADLSGAVLVGADLAGADLRRASLLNADLTEADLRRTSLIHADFQRATCARTALRGADLADAYLWDVDLSSTYLDGVELHRANDLEGKRATAGTGGPHRPTQTKGRP